MLIITNFIQHVLHCCILILECSRVSEGYRGKPGAVVQQNTFQRSLSVDNKQSYGAVPLQHCAEAAYKKTEVLLMSVASTAREGFLFLQYGCQQFSRGL